MSRSLFFLITAIIGLLFGLLMMVAPHIQATNVGFEPSAQLSVFVRAYGAAILAAAVLNYLVRNEPDSVALKAALWSNVTLHLLITAMHVHVVATGVVALGAVIPGQVANFFVLFGSLYFIRRMTV